MRTTQNSQRRLPIDPHSDPKAPSKDLKEDAGKSSLATKDELSSSC